jgi:acylphosphatase
MRRRLTVSGRVQGVFFRDTVRNAAEREHVGGWVRNRPDGTVEAAFEGSPDAVERLIALCRQGPPGARVEKVEVWEETDEGTAKFLIR